MDTAQDSRAFLPAGAAVAPPDSGWSFAAHLLDNAPFLLGWVVALAVFVAVGYVALKIGPIILRTITNSNEAISSASATFESLEASVTSSISTQTKSIRQLGKGLQSIYDRVKAIEKKLDSKGPDGG